ncbi:MAG: hypothetical protein D6741_12970 [Planctomycetota bacterium]|nr:MAG: hypothetical protein D6741_12970 [Planctomycetota bacterium]
MSSYLSIVVRVILPTFALVCAATPSTAAEKVLLRYKFLPGETVAWDVTHRAAVRTTISGTTQSVETLTRSTKLWQIDEVRGDDTFVLRNFVTHVDMTQRVSGRRELRFSTDDEGTPPPEFQPIAETVDKPLAVITLNARGQIVSRKQLVEHAAQSIGNVTVPLPEEPVGEGDSWVEPMNIELPDTGGRIMRVKAQQKFTLERLQSGIAVIRMQTQILTPIENPAMEAKLVQHLLNGTVRFDVDAGRIVAQQLDVDKEIVGFRGDASSFHYATRFEEKLLDKEAAVAALPADAKR